jgi:CHAD domain-containing protein
MLHGVDAGAVRAVHRTRVASRRLRELMPVLQLDRDSSDKIGRRLRRVTRRLGAVRELDVLLQLIDELRTSRAYPDHALRCVAADVRQARATAHHEACGNRASAERRRVARKLEKVCRQMEKSIPEGHAGRAWRWAIEARVARRAATVEQAIGEAGSVYLQERLHLVRISLKKLRYGIELEAEAAGDGGSADLRTLKRGQEILGRMHDLQVLIDRVRRVHAAQDPRALSLRRDLDGLVTELDKSCRRLHARYVRQRKGLLAICRRLTVRTQSASKTAASKPMGPAARARQPGVPLQRSSSG